MPDLIPFQFENFDVRVHLDENGLPWWILTDICSVMGLTNPSKVTDRLKSNEYTTLTFSENGRPLSLLLVNEKGLYRLIMRSNKPEAEAFQEWVFGEVLPQIRQTGAYQPEPPRVPLLCEVSIPDQIAILRETVAFFQELGVLDGRDKLMMADIIRTEIQQQHFAGVPGGQKALPAPQGFFLSERVRALGYNPSRKDEAALMSKGLARDVAQEYRKRYDTKPMQSQRFVDGAVRPVYWYVIEDAEWIDPLIQLWCARCGILL